MAGGLAWMFTHHEWKKDNAGYTSGMGERKKEGGGHHVPCITTFFRVLNTL